jgi:aminoglycoside 6'-N-acetyltransferase I
MILRLTEQWGWRGCCQSHTKLKLRVVEEAMNVIRPITEEDHSEWLRMRQTLWPYCPTESHLDEMQTILGSDSQAGFVAVHPEGGLCGFAEVSVHPYDEDYRTRPVGYLEGWYVDFDLRQQEIGKELVGAAERWAITKGCIEMASDTSADNSISRRAHNSLGYEEATVVVRFRKRIGPNVGATPSKQQ